MPNCLFCGVETPRRKFCSAACGSKDWAKKNPERLKALRTEIYKRERAAKYEKDFRSKDCAVCSQKFFAKYTLGFNSAMTCGKITCLTEYRKIYNRPFNNAYIKKVRSNPNYPSKPCKWCEQIFRRKLDELYCSQNCTAAQASKEKCDRLAQELEDLKKKFTLSEKILQCLMCRNEFTNLNRNFVFCRECRVKFPGKRLSKYLIRFRDGFQCQICRSEMPEAALEVHHKIPRSQGGSDAKENLITICPNCHTLIHRCGFTIDSLKAQLSSGAPYDFKGIEAMTS